jgi:TonB family protein
MVEMSADERHGPSMTHRSLAASVLAITMLLSGCASERERAPSPPTLPEAPPIVPAAPRAGPAVPAAGPAVVLDTQAPIARAKVEALARERVDRAPRVAASARERAETSFMVSDPKQFRGTVELGAVERTGGAGRFDTATLALDMMYQLGALRTCYERSLFSDITLRGTATVDFTLDPTGAISSATAAAGTDPRLAACSVDAVKRVRFKPGPAGGSVSYRCPITFSAAAL